MSKLDPVSSYVAISLPLEMFWLEVEDQGDTKIFWLQMQYFTIRQSYKIKLNSNIKCSE